MTYNIENRRYTGSKAKLLDWIIQLINKECEGEIFLDIFAGTGVVAASASKHFDHIILNDILHSNNIIYKAFFDPREWDKNKLQSLLERYNQIKSHELKENFFSENFQGKYFGDEAKIIGFIREDIESRRDNLNEKEYCMLLASLLYSIDKISNTVGHYDAYIQRPPNNKKFQIKLINPINIKKVEIFKEDANLLARQIKADIVYIDPPYNSRQYSRFYHLLETLIKWDKSKLFGVAMKPEPENMSEYCKVKAPEVFKKLIQDLNCKYIVVSYNNTYNSKSNSSKNKIQLEEIKKILRNKGKTKTFERSHKYFNSGKTSFDNHKEFIFITKVK